MTILNRLRADLRWIKPARVERPVGCSSRDLRSPCGQGNAFV